MYSLTPPNLCCSGGSDIFPKLGVVALSMLCYVSAKVAMLSVRGMIGKLGNRVYNIYGCNLNHDCVKPAGVWHLLQANTISQRRHSFLFLISSVFHVLKGCVKGFMVMMVSG